MIEINARVKLTEGGRANHHNHLHEAVGTVIGVSDGIARVKWDDVIRRYAGAKGDGAPVRGPGSVSYIPVSRLEAV